MQGYDVARESLDLGSLKTVRQAWGYWQKLEKTLCRIRCLLHELNLLVWSSKYTHCSQDFWDLDGGSGTRRHNSGDSSSSLDRKMWLSPRLFWFVLWGKLTTANLHKLNSPNQPNRNNFQNNSGYNQFSLFIAYPIFFFLTSTHSMKHREMRMVLLWPRSRNHIWREIFDEN